MPPPSGAAPHPDRTPGPLPSEAEADAFFREVPASRSSEAARSVGWRTTSRRLRARTPDLRAVAAVVAVGLTLTAVAVSARDARDRTPSGPSSTALPPGFFEGGACLSDVPPTTDVPSTVVSCTSTRVTARVVGVAVLVVPGDAYPGPAEVVRLARGLCYQDFGLGGPVTAGEPALVSVPGEQGWSAGERYVVCAVPAP